MPSEVEKILFDMQREIHSRYWTMDYFGFRYEVEDPCSEDPTLRLQVSCEGVVLLAGLSITKMVDEGHDKVMTEFKDKLDGFDGLLRDRESG